MMIKPLKYTICLVCLFLLLDSFLVCHAEISWRLTNGTLYISGSGAMPDYGSAAETPWYDKQDNIVSVSVSSPVTHIGSYAFYGLPNATSITIGSSVKSIGSYAFSHCTALMSVSIPSCVSTIGDHAFLYNTAMYNLTLANGITSIGDYAFDRCYNLTTISIPDSVKHLGSYTFGHCDRLKTVNLGNGVESIGSNCFYSGYSLADITIPASVTSLGDFSFGNCPNLKSAVVESAITTLAPGTFSYCGLSSVTLPRTLTAIDKRAFMYCDDLKTVTFCGNRREWLAITIAEDNDVLSGATISCTESLYISKASHQNGILSLTATAEAPMPAGLLVFCVYDAEGRFVCTSRKAFSPSDTTATVKLSALEGGSARIVLWKAFSCRTPLTGSDCISY